MFPNFKHIEIYTHMYEGHDKMLTIKYAMDSNYRSVTGTLKNYVILRNIEKKKTFAVQFFILHYFKHILFGICLRGALTDDYY